jgi:hypothetical protein
VAPLYSERLSHLCTLLSTTITPRPLLTHLNSDNTWLLSLPIPYHNSSTPPKNYFHILIDPWLTPSNFIAAWFLTQYHVDVPAYATIAEVEDLIRDIEEAASGISINDSGTATLDAAVTNHTNTDHTNRETLLQLAPSVPVYSSPAASKIIESWKHFDHVYTMPSFEKDGVSDWRIREPASTEPLPEWLNFWRLGWKEGFPGVHFGLMVAWESIDGGKDGDAECLVLSPHGIYVNDVKAIAEADPAIETLAVLHTTKEAWSWPFGKANLGARNGLEVVREKGARYCRSLL